MIIPSIDLMNGKAVQLRQGREKIIEIENPILLAGKFSKFGPLAVIDLDGAMGKGTNEAIIKDICRIAECRVGGGVRSIEKAEKILEMGAEKIIIGTSAWEGKKLNKSFLRSLIDIAGTERIILALDCYKEQVMINGWQVNTGVKIFEVLKDVEEYASELLVTCVEKEGCLQGTALDFFKKLRDFTEIPITAAGGITSLEEIASLIRLQIDVQLGTAIYIGILKLEDAFIASLNWDKWISGLLPCVVEDEYGQILMHAWISPESLKRTFETGKTCFFSRSRKGLWTKGESSGNFQILIKARVDCDGDTVLFVVKQKGRGGCHKGGYSCFGDKRFRLEDLYEVVLDRIINPREGSYTSTLNDKKVREKLQEELIELIETKKREEIVWETADLLYFLMVLLARERVAIQDVFKELKRRRQKG